ncbi:MAG: DNA-3-methyladenine glycosylase [Planctomycetia bacterium]|nr:DNA-3-methyladenine glycosylase [Planctomycetia bacterium]
MAKFKYGKKEIDHLAKKDPALGRAIDRIGPIECELNPDLFSALVKSIVWQQLSNKAASTIHQRLLDRIGDPNPEAIFNTSPDDLRSCGLSFRKAEYVREIARRLLAEEFPIGLLPDLPDEEVIDLLVSLPGVGIWTAEMLLIFSLGRPNILSWGDLGIRNALMKVHRKKELTKDQFQRYAKKYSPFGTVASLYLWQIADED